VRSVDYFIPDAQAEVPSHAIAAYIDAYTQSDGLIVDPFCRSAAIVLQALKAGRRVVAVCFNPLAALRTRLALTPAPARELDAAVTQVGDSLKHDLTLRAHLQHLYRTTCRTCGGQTVADYFVWERGGEQPSQVHYDCPSCQQSGLWDCNESDLQVLHEVEPRGLYYWYVLDRIARDEDKGRKFAVQLLDLYTPRNLYVLSNLALKIEDLFAKSPLGDFLRLSFLQCLELGSKLNAVPGEPAPPRSAPLRPPPRFIEHNVWRLFEHTARQLGRQQPVSAVTLAADPADLISGESGDKAFVGQLSARELVSRLPAGSVDLIWTRPPLVGREHWAMTYLWTGWLYGHEESALLWPLVRKRTPDWPWYLQALRTTFSAMRKVLAPEGRIVFFAQDRELAYHETLVLAAAAAALRLQNALYQPSEEMATAPYGELRGAYQTTCTLGAPAPPWPITRDELAATVRQVAVQAAEKTLQQRAEPAPFARLHCHIWEALAQQGLLQRIMSMEELPSPLEFAPGQIQAALEREFERTFTQLWDSEEELTCWWWLANPPDTLPLTERVEEGVCELLESVRAIGTREFLCAIHKQFPGLLTPDHEWIMACLKSYAEQVAPERWSLKEEEHLAHRVQAREMNLGCLKDLGRRLGYDVRLGAGGFDAQWVQPDGDVLVFVALDSAALSRALNLAQPSELPPVRRTAIVTTARQELIRRKLARSIWLRKLLAEQGWQFIRDADLRDWASQPQVSLADLDSFVGLDLLAAQDRTQLPLI
jgi:hypothetical protein